ncbi:Cadmium-transporting ATPase [Bertholletia excelsa]
MELITSPSPSSSSNFNLLFPNTPKYASFAYNFNNSSRVCRGAHHLRAKQKLHEAPRASKFAVFADGSGNANVGNGNGNGKSSNGSARRSLTATSTTSNTANNEEPVKMGVPRSTSSALELLDIERGVCIPFRKYTPETVRNKVLGSRRDILSLVGRGIEIVWNLGLYWSTLMYDCLVGRDKEVVPYRARQLRNLLCNLGPSFIKAGQVLANRPDIIREDYMNELCILQDDVPPFPNQVAFNIIEEELGQPLEAVFSRISSETIAAASLGQVYRATLRTSGEDVAIKVLRPEIEPIIYRDLFLFRTLASFLNGISLQKLGCNAELIVDEFGEKLLEELDYTLEARNIEDFLENFKDDPTVKIPRVYKKLSGSRVLVMEWIDGIRCTNPQAIKDAGIDVNGFLTIGVSAALRQLLEFGLFHGDPHPGNIFAMRDGRIAYVDFGNVAVLSQLNKQILIDAVVHAVNEDYVEMANDFTRLGFLASGTDVSPIIPALEAIWQNSVGKGLSDFNFRSVTGKFNQLVYQYPIRIPERFSLVIRSLLTQEGICFTLKPDFKFLEVAYPYVAKRLLTDPNPALRERLIQVLFKDGVFQWKRLENLIVLAKENVTKMNTNPALQGNVTSASQWQRSRDRQIERKLDLTDTIKDGTRLFLLDEGIRRQLLLALTEDSKLHIQELVDVYRLVEDQIDMPQVALEVVRDLPSVARDLMLSWSNSILSDR